VQGKAISDTVNWIALRQST